MGSRCHPSARVQQSFAVHQADPGASWQACSVCLGRFCKQPCDSVFEGHQQKLLAIPLYMIRLCLSMSKFICLYIFSVLEVIKPLAMTTVLPLFLID